MPLNKSYSNYVSLGSFCSVAMELERFGLRSASFPFDWLLSDFRGVVEAINSNFGAFFDESFLNNQNKGCMYIEIQNMALNSCIIFQNTNLYLLNLMFFVKSTIEE